MSRDELYYINLINAVCEKFNSIAQEFEDNATSLESKVRERCTEEVDKDRILYSDIRRFIEGAVLLRKKASMYRHISDCLLHSRRRIISDKKFDKNIKKLFEDFIDGEIDFEKAVDEIIKILKNIIGISINKDEYYNVSEYEVRKRLNELCMY